MFTVIIHYWMHDTCTHNVPVSEVSALLAGIDMRKVSDITIVR